MRFVQPFIFTALTAVFAVGCAHSIQKHEYPATTNPTAEITQLEADLAAAAKNQAHVLSPNHFADARKKLDEAKKENQDADSNSDTLEDLGYARAHLNAANEITAKAEAAIPEVVKARATAIESDAPKFRAKELKKADADLMDRTEDFENGKWEVSVKERGELQKKYIDVQIMATKAAYLDETKGLIEAARKMDAKKYTEATLASALAKLQTAERTIETDVNNTAAIVRTSDDARREAKRLVALTEVARDSKNKSPEELALAMEAKQKEIARSEAEAARSQNRLSDARETIQTQRGVIAMTAEEKAELEGQKAKLEGEQAYNAAFAKAAETFTKDEAVVYRQGDNLVVRLKQVQFPTGRSDLPADSMNVLAKVKDVIETMGAEKVVVEGHTDATGSKAKNKTLSEKRAQAVAQYFVANDVVPSEQVQAQGFGDTKPLMSNKTKDGRAQNRRVDVVITPPGLASNSGSNSNTGTGSSTNQ